MMKKELKEQKNDPEIRAILSDPIMQSVLREMQSDPSSIQKHMQNKDIKTKIEKLITSGILQKGERPQKKRIKLLFNKNIIFFFLF